MQQAIIPLEEEQEQSAVCPFCGGIEAYVLGDGRRKCKACRAKFTPCPRPGRLGSQALHGLSRHFWLMTPMEQVARELSLNRKTVQRYFHLIRSRIAQHGQQKVEAMAAPPDLQGLFTGRIRSGNNGTSRVTTVPIFGLALNDDGQVQLVFVDGFGDCSGLDLGSVTFVPLQAPEPRFTHGAAPQPPQAFWQFARQALKHYRGGYKRILPQYLREMEFRFNHLHDSMVSEHIYDLIMAGPH